MRRARLLIAGALLIGAPVLFVAPYAGTALVVSRPLTHPDVIVSLGSHEWERLPETARLAAVSPEARVVLTQPQVVSDVNCHDCANRVSRLVHMGIDRARITVVQLTAGGTHGEALACLLYARENRIRRLLVVTSPYHTRRSLATFREVFGSAGVEIGIQPATDTSPADPVRWWRTPYDRAYVRYEWLAIPYYAVRYGVFSS